MNLSDADDIVGRLIQAKAKVLHECMHDVAIRFHGEKVYDLSPTDIGNLYMGQQVVLFGHYRGSGDTELEMTARISGQEQSWRCRVNLPETDTTNPELERLWALSRIDETMETVRDEGETEARRQQIVRLGVAYSLVTDYTSMLVVREDVMESEGIQRRNARRVHRERTAQATRVQAPATNYRVDQGQSTFQGRVLSRIRAHSRGVGIREGNRPASGRADGRPGRGGQAHRRDRCRAARVHGPGAVFEDGPVLCAAVCPGLGSGPGGSQRCAQEALSAIT